MEGLLAGFVSDSYPSMFLSLQSRVSSMNGRGLVCFVDTAFQFRTSPLLSRFAPPRIRGEMCRCGVVYLSFIVYLIVWNVYEAHSRVDNAERNGCWHVCVVREGDGMTEEDGCHGSWNRQGWISNLFCQPCLRT